MSREEWIPGNKSELLSAIEGEWNLLMEVVTKLDQAQMTLPDDGGWCPKDNLAHLAEWMNILMGFHMDRRPSHEVLGVPEEVTKEWDFNVINAVLYERSKDRSVDDVLEQLKSKYQALIKKLDLLTFDDLLEPRFDDDPQKTPVLLWVLENTTRHFTEHRTTIEKNL